MMKRCHSCQDEHDDWGKQDDWGKHDDGDCGHGKQHDGHHVDHRKIHKFTHDCCQKFQHHDFCRKPVRKVINCHCGKCFEVERKSRCCNDW